MKQIKNNLSNIILIIWIYLNFITNIFSIFLPGSIPSILKYAILAASGAVLLIKNKFKIRKSVLTFSLLYLAILILNLLMVNYDKYVIVEALTSFLILIIPIYIFSEKEFNLQIFNEFWYGLRKYFYGLSLITFIIYKFGLLKYSAFDNIVLPTLFIICFQYNKNNYKNKLEFLLMLALLGVQALFGGRMAGLSGFFIFFLCLIFLRKNTRKRKIIYCAVLAGLLLIALLNLTHIVNFLLSVCNVLGIKARTLILLKQQIAEGSLYLTNRDSIYLLASDFIINRFGLPGGFAVIRNLTHGEYYHAHNLILNLFCFFGIYGTAIISFWIYKKVIQLKKLDKYCFSFGMILLSFYLFRSITGTYFLTSIYAILIVSLLFFYKKEEKDMEKQNIIITGGGSFNKGAQSMLFITVDECKKRFPNHNILVLSTKDYQKHLSEPNPYNFTFLPNNFFVKLYVQGGILKCLATCYLILKPKLYSLAKEIEQHYKRAELCIDISGFAVSSKFSWKTWVMYFLNILNAKKHRVPVYLMPQSFGPFDFSPVVKIIFMPLMRTSLNYPKIVYCREQDGYDLLKNKIKAALRLSYDMVLLNKGVNLENVYLKEPKNPKFTVKKHSVAIIPNQKLLNNHNEEELLKTYKTIISKLLKSEYYIYIVRHSFEDYDFCVKIKELFKNDENVLLMTDDINCTAFNNLVKKFDFVVGSRYHSIVHSFKNTVPCIVLGWAVKYERLLEGFSQSKYLLNINKAKTATINKIIDQMIEFRKEESKTIQVKLTEIQKENIFKFLDVESSD